MTCPSGGNTHITQSSQTIIPWQLFLKFVQNPRTWRLLVRWGIRIFSIIETEQPEKIISTKGEKYRHYIEKCFSHSPLNIPGCLNLKAGHSFGYREAVREAERSPGPVYHLDEIVEQTRLKKMYAFDDLDRILTEASDLDKKTISIKRMIISLDLAPLRQPSALSGRTRLARSGLLELPKGQTLHLPVLLAQASMIPKYSPPYLAPSKSRARINPKW